MNNNTKYDQHQQALSFMNDTSTQIDIVYLKTGHHFDDDVEARDIYEITITTPRGSYTFEYGDSLHNTWKRAYAKTRDERLLRKLQTNHKNSTRELVIWRTLKPTPYDILSVMCKRLPGSFEDFCGDYGYSTDSIRATRYYDAIRTEWNAMQRLYTDEQLERMAEIE